MSDAGIKTIESLLSELNHWETKYGNTYPPRAGLATTGEASARIAELKAQLRARGAVFHWAKTAYVIDKVLGPNKGHQESDEL